MKRQLTLGSLFDGIGGFPLAVLKTGIRPVWASEIEPFPVRVTTMRLPDMRHLGDIHDIDGGRIEPVNIITFGSPCQNLSIAGNRAGLSGKQSSLFFEAVRVIQEMRSATNGKQPRWVVWENVPYALSSNNGQDFREILESFVRVRDIAAVVPMPESGRWLPAGEIMGDSCSLAWRVLDASKGWGVAQRRRRIFAVLDFDGQCAGQVLFESEGLSGYTPPVGGTRQDAAGEVEEGAGASGGKGGAVAFEPGSLNRHQQTFVLQGSMIGRGDENGPQGSGINEEVCFTLNTVDKPAVVHARDPSYCMTVGHFAQVEIDRTPTLEVRGFKDPPVVRKTPPTEYMVRRLMPRECARLQGFPDDWCMDLETPDPSEQEIAWWSDVFEIRRRAEGKINKPKTSKQIAKWLKDPHRDAAEYKAYGNSVAVPCVFFVLAGIAWVEGMEG